MSCFNKKKYPRWPDQLHMCSTFDNWIQKFGFDFQFYFLSTLSFRHFDLDNIPNMTFK